MGAPGWPEFAFCTASIDRVRMVSIASFSIPGWGTGTPDVGKERRRGDWLFLAHRRARYKAQVGVSLPGAALRYGFNRLGCTLRLRFAMGGMPATLSSTDVR